MFFPFFFFFFLSSFFFRYLGGVSGFPKEMGCDLGDRGGCRGFAAKEGGN